MVFSIQFWMMYTLGVYLFIYLFPSFRPSFLLGPMLLRFPCAKTLALFSFLFFWGVSLWNALTLHKQLLHLICHCVSMCPIAMYTSCHIWHHWYCLNMSYHWRDMKPGMTRLDMAYLNVSKQLQGRFSGT